MAYLAYANGGAGQFFAAMRPEDEYLRPVPESVHHEWSETSMFGFNIPEEGIDCIVYFWHRPAMKITYGGIMIWQGLNTNQVECLYSDYRSAMPLPDDITDCRYANGVRIRMITPLEEFHISFADTEREMELDLHLKAMMPPACRYNGNHLTQAMKTSGTLKLDGRTRQINGFHTRDRSWNEERHERPQAVPPVLWSVGIADANFAFHHVSMDDPAYHPEWAGKVPEIDKTCLWGYIYENGQTHGVIATRQRADYGLGGIVPIHVETTLEAANGKTYEIVGEWMASTQIQPWPNMCSNFILMKWTINGTMTAYGDVQMGLFRDAYRTLTGKTDAPVDLAMLTRGAGA